MPTSKPFWIPADAVLVGTVWIWSCPGKVNFEEPGGVEGHIDAEGITLEVEDRERSTSWAGDCPSRRTLPRDAMLHAVALWKRENT